jgi:FtsP/CotA-like multicopper oxidase with cupredoxin domain
MLDRLLVGYVRVRAPSRPRKVRSRLLAHPGLAGQFDSGWKDTVDVRLTEIVDVAVRFTDYRGPYMLHCHNLEHEDMAMMAAYETVWSR